MSILGKENQKFSVQEGSENDTIMYKTRSVQLDPSGQGKEVGGNIREVGSSLTVLASPRDSNFVLIAMGNHWWKTKDLFMYR